MKSMILLLFVTIFLFGIESDYEIVQNFKKEYENIQLKLRSAATNSEVDKLIVLKEALLEKYKDKQELIDNSIYPDKFYAKFETLDRQLNSVKTEIDLTDKNIKLSDELSEAKKQITNLSNKITMLNDEFSELKKANEDLKRKIGNSKNKNNSKAKNEYQEQLTLLKENLKKRDELISALLENLFTNYEKSPDGDNVLIKKAGTDNNLYENIAHAIQDNINFLKTDLSYEDLKFSGKEYDRFYMNWSKVSSVLKNSGIENTGFETDKEKYELIDNNLRTWNVTYSDKVVDKFSSELKKREITLEKFSGITGFVNSFEKYVDSDYRNLSDSKVRFVRDTLWNQQIVGGWSDLLLKERRVNKEDIQRISSKLSEDKKPAENSLLWLLGSLAGVTLIYILIKKAFKPKNEGTYS
ncbi:MAG: hypothetical protein JXR48_06090 [Candidatus Delongbacteria bacterium]|nr:hypothetical protein [Candidatus Delongbacteria bacterium]MBN2834521.1 hypothetical protein [Candidatus Delongbacteria bacterium]